LLSQRAQSTGKGRAIGLSERRGREGVAMACTPRGRGVFFFPERKKERRKASLRAREGRRARAAGALISAFRFQSSLPRPFQKGKEGREVRGKKLHPNVPPEMKARVHTKKERGKVKPAHPTAGKKGGGATQKKLSASRRKKRPQASRDPPEKSYSVHGNRKKGKKERPFPF